MTGIWINYFDSGCERARRALCADALVLSVEYDASHATVTADLVPHLHEDRDEYAREAFRSDWFRTTFDSKNVIQYV